MIADNGLLFGLWLRILTADSWLVAADIRLLTVHIRSLTAMLLIFDGRPLTSGPCRLSPPISALAIDRCRAPVALGAPPV